MRPVQVVTSIGEEELLMGVCTCGDSRQVVSERLVPLDGRWYDSIVSNCPACHTLSGFLFDVTPFYQPHPRVWASYGVVRDG